MYLGLKVKHLLFFSDFNESWSFSTDFLKNAQRSHFMKTHPVRAELFRAEVSNTDGRTDRQTDMTKLIVALCNFANAPKVGYVKSVYLCVFPSPVAQNTYIFCQWTFTHFFESWFFCSGCVSNRPHLARAIESGLGTPPPFKGRTG